MWKGFTERTARTSPDSPDSALSGRTYSIPFDSVWNAALDLARSELKGWKLISCDDVLGVIRADIRGLLLPLEANALISVTLDPDAQTRVDMSALGNHRGGDLGVNRRRIKHFFRALDRSLRARPGQILEPRLKTPTPAHPGRAFLLCAAAALAAGAACSGEGGDDNPEEAGGNSGAVESEGEGSGFSAMRTYYRTVVFADVSKDPTMFVPWDFENRADADGIHRILRGWLGRGGTWRRFANEEWDTPPSRTPWRILPRGSVRLVMGFNDDLRELYYLEGFRDLSVQPGPVMAEWSGQRGDTYRLRAGSARLSGVEYEGVVVDAYAPRVGGSDPPSEWCLLIGDGSLYVLIADLEGPGAHRAWVLRDSEETFWPAVTITWDETRSFQPARREIPVLWGFRSDDGVLAGEIESTSSDPRKLEGEGLVLPVLVVHEVAGQVTIGDEHVAVKGFLRHLQR